MAVAAGGDDLRLIAIQIAIRRLEKMLLNGSENEVVN
jgi:hypothetical protein